MINHNQAVSVMINEEDHLRIQVLRSGFKLKKAWNAINDFDSVLEEHLDYAFSSNLQSVEVRQDTIIIPLEGSRSLLVLHTKQ